MKEKYTLAKLQAAYLPITLRKEQTKGVGVCMHCWQSGCDCESTGDVNSDPFINLTEEHTISKYLVAN